MESVSDGEGGALRLAVGLARRRLTERCLVAQDTKADAGHLVGQCADGLVVVGAALDLGSPVTDAGELRSLAGCRGGRAQDGSRAMGQQHAQVLVATLADAPEVAGAAGGGLLWCQAEPGGEVAGIGEVGDASSRRRSDGSRREQSHTGDAHQQTTGGRLGNDGSELPFDLGDVGLEHADLVEQGPAWSGATGS